MKKRFFVAFITSLILMSANNLKAEEIEEVTANNVEEFVKAIASNTTIYLEDKDYELSPDFKFESDNVIIGHHIFIGLRESEEIYGELVIKGIENLSIIGKENTRILAYDRNRKVMCFEDCEDITLKNLFIGHTVYPGPRQPCGPASMVLTICEGKNIEIENCTLFGTGNIGLWLFKVENLRFLNSIIKDCTEKILSIGFSNNITFENSLFKETFADFECLISIGSSKVDFYNCRIEDNVIRFGKDEEGSSSMFCLFSPGEVSMRNTIIKNNRFRDLSLGDYKIDTSGCTITDNKW